jgi:Fe-S cluster assembly protein SufD|tara:strand:- start:656 stop:1234 length:579 start_codon:yes stop_codon:yes gene_type:complete
MSSNEYVIEKHLETKINIAEFDTLNFKVMPNAKACLFFETKGKDISSTQINVELEENSSCELYGFFKNIKRTTNLITNVVHKGNKSTCNQDFRFVNKRGTSSFEGKITVPKDVIKCESHMLNKNVLLDDESDAFAKPELDINNDDVICTHGCTIGALDEDAIFYLQSRGYTKEEAVDVLVEAFAHIRTQEHI